MSAHASTVTTASITPDLFPEPMAHTLSRAWLFTALSVVVLLGFGFRVFQLGAEGLSEDELNKVRAVEEYRTHGLTSANGEHPFLMKALLTASVAAVEKWNVSPLAASNPQWQFSLETAVRLPGALLGAFTSLLIFLVASELFGVEIGFIAAVWWAFDPAGIGFNRIAKEDSFLLFFFLLANLFWLSGQRVAEAGEPNPEPYYWATAAAFGAMLASKYLPHYLSISVSYYYIFQNMPATRWRLGKRRWLLFFVVMGSVFLICNPTILLPGTWQEIRIFAGEKRIGHDSYEFLGELYRNQMTLWLKGVPWYFYYVFMGVKLPLTLLAAFLIGLPLLFTRRLGDGRFFILFWIYYWFFPFTVMGGKFTRYFTFALPLVLITAAIGLHFVAGHLARLAARMAASQACQSYVRVGVPLLVLAFSAYASVSAAPHYRLYTNTLGGGSEQAGNYFPHDEFYDASLRQTINLLAVRAHPGARVASETPELVTFYARREGRTDFHSVSLSDPEAMQEFSAGDVVILARGRRYFSNEQITTQLRAANQPTFNVSLGGVPASETYIIDEAGVAAIRQAWRR